MKPWEVDRFTPAEMFDWLDAHREQGPVGHPGDAALDDFFDKAWGPQGG